VINDVVFEILVYACDQEAFIRRVESDADKTMALVPGKGTDFWKEQRNDEIQRHMKSVRYNETVGCIEIHIVGTQLRADYWFTDKARVVLGSNQKGTIKHRGKLLERSYNLSKLSSAEIFKDFRKALDRAIRENGRLKNRFTNFEAFDRCGPFIDWCSMLRRHGA
jgi:hypothetical protein